MEKHFTFPDRRSFTWLAFIALTSLHLAFASKLATTTTTAATTTTTTTKTQVFGLQPNTSYSLESDEVLRHSLEQQARHRCRCWY
jgi:hypothetical protein